jgi:hypothetical protein
MSIIIAYDPGPSYQQRIHQNYMELPEGTTDEAAIREAERHHTDIIGIGVWENEEWRTIYGTLP